MDGLFNISRGRAVEYHERVRLNDPTNAALILVVLAAAGLESDDVLRDYDTLGAILASTNAEPGQAQYGRKTLTDAVLTAPTIDDTNDKVSLTIPSQTWTSVVAGDSWAKVLTCIDLDTTAGTDANIIPIAFQDMLVNGAYVIPNGSNIQWAVPNGYYVSSA